MPRKIGVSSSGKHKFVESYGACLIHTLTIDSPSRKRFHGFRGRCGEGAPLVRGLIRFFPGKDT